jgi:hypothetical protein
MLFAEGMACVRLGEKYGYISKEGKYAINPSYKEGTFFHEGFATAVNENGFPMYINKDGEIKFTISKADKARAFSEGLAAIQIKNKWGFINSSGAIEITPAYDYVSDFREGLATFNQKSKDKTLVGYISKKGEIKISPKFDEAYAFNEGLALIKMNDKFGYIDNEGKIIITPQFEAAYPFQEGFAIIKQGDSYGYIDKSGKTIINPQFKEAGAFSEGIAMVVSTDNKYGYIDKEGKYTINPQFEEAGDFKEGRAYVKIGEKYGLIDKKGTIVVNPQFDEIYSWKSYFNTIESDYFDDEGVFELLIGNSGSETFRGINNQTTLRYIIETEHKGSEVDEEGLSSVSVKDEIIINEYVKISKLSYTFSSRVYSYVTNYDYSYYLGYYPSGVKKKFNYDATVSNVSYTVKLEGKASNKSTNIRKALVNKISKLLNTPSIKLDEKDVFEGDKMSVKVYPDPILSSSEIVIDVSFE